MRRKAVVVLGMHRSGTSALTRLLNLAGAFLPEKLMPPVPGNNERGFWEPVDLVALDERALASAGVAWDSPRRIDPAWFDGEAAEGFVAELVRFFETDFPGEPLFVLKDPRLCRIMPLLARAFDRASIDAAYVLSLRHPSAVAGSLEQRDGMPRDHGRALWLRYTLDAEHWTRGMPRVAVEFSDVLADWAGVLDRVSAQLGTRLDAGAEVGRAVGEFLEPQLVHHRGDDATPLPMLIAEAWSAFNGMLTEGDGNPVRMRLDRVRAALDVADEVLGAAFSHETRMRIRMQQRVRSVEGELNRQEAVLKQQETVLEHRQEQIQNLRSQLDAARAELARWRRQASQLDERLKFLRSMAQAAMERGREEFP
jgi:hypothetical protein